MTTVRLSDVVIPEVYLSYQAEDAVELTAFFQSGVAITDQVLSAEASSGGNEVNIPFWKDLDRTEDPNISSDDPGVSATPSKIITGRQIARAAYLNKPYQAADLAGIIAGSNPMQRIRNRFGSWWNYQLQRRILATMEGILADNVANDSSDMVIDISGATNADVTADTIFNRKAFTAAAFTSGDHWDDYTAIAVHSTVAQTMADNDDIEFIRDSEGNIVNRTYLGRTVIIDDSLPFTPAAGTGPGDAAAQYTSILFGSGAVGYGEAMPDNAVEIDRDILGGNGGGIETIIERKNWMVHPFGFATGTAPAAEGGYTLAELKLAASWNRVVARKNVPLAFIISNA